MNATKGVRIAAIERTYAGTTDTLHQARADACDVLGDHGLDALVDDARLIVSELTSNAIEASPERPYRVEIRSEGDQVVISVSNESAATPPTQDSWHPADPLASHGRGLMIARALSKHIEVDAHNSQVTVSAYLAIPVG